MSYATAVQVKEYLGISGTVVDDNLLDDLIERAEGLIDAYTGRSFVSTTATKFFDDSFTNGSDLNLWGYDLLTVTKLTNGDGVEVTSSDYRLFPRNDNPKWMLRLDEAYSWNFSDGDSEISVAGTWGYSATPPLDIQHACVRLAAFLYRQKDNSADIDRPMITGDGVTIMPSALPVDVTRILDRYKRRVI
ncbi:MAG: head-tail connector protein [bacterium]|jgi:hypothetical protein|nr:head-tail connector protein [bacterium]